MIQMSQKMMLKVLVQNKVNKKENFTHFDNKHEKVLQNMNASDTDNVLIMIEIRLKQ